MNLLKETPNGGEKNYKCHPFKGALIIPHQKLTTCSQTHGQWQFTCATNCYLKCSRKLVFSDSDQVFQRLLMCYGFGVLMCTYIYFQCIHRQEYFILVHLTNRF